MADAQCDYPGCIFSAVERCNECGLVYCVKHIQRIGIYNLFTCDPCIQRQQEETRKANEAFNKGCSLAMLVTLGLGLVIGGCVVLWIALSGRTGNPVGGVIADVLIGIGLIIGGLILLIRLGNPAH